MNIPIEQEYGRVSALKIDRFNSDTRTLETIYIPQLEIIKYSASSGKTISQNFYCINDGEKTVELNQEIDALYYAMKVRDYDLHVLIKE